MNKVVCSRVYLNFQVVNNINNFSFPFIPFPTNNHQLLGFLLSKLDSLRIHIAMKYCNLLNINEIFNLHLIWVYWAFSHPPHRCMTQLTTYKENRVVNSIKSSKCRLCFLTRLFISITNLSVLKAKEEFIKKKNNSNGKNERLKIQSVIFLFELTTAVTCTQKVPQEILLFLCGEKFK